MGSSNFDFESFSPDSSLGISEGKALGVGGIWVRGRGVLKGLLVGLRGKWLIWGFGQRGNRGTGRKVGTGIGFGFELFSPDSYLGI